MNICGTMVLRADKHLLREVLFEFYRIGRSVRVSAIDPSTGTEVQVIGDSNQGCEAMKRVAVAKLHYELAKRGRRAERFDE